MREAAQLGRRGNNPNRILKAVMDMMKERYCSGKYERLTLEEILSELKLTQLTTELRGWLLEALKHNPKIDFSSEQESFLFLPSLGGNVRNYKQLLKKLMEYDRMGLGGIPTSEIKEALSNPDKALHVRSCTYDDNVLTSISMHRNLTREETSFVWLEVTKKK